MGFGADSEDADVIFFSAFDQYGRSLTFEDLAGPDLDIHFVRAWLHRAEARAWLRRDGERWCLTESGAAYWAALRPEMGISNRIEIGLPANAPAFRPFRRRRRRR